MHWVVDIHVMGQIILSGIAAFIVLYYMGIYAMKIPLVAKYAKAFSAISFPFYLLHHTILALTSSPFFGNEACSTPRKYYILFTAFCTTVFAACVVKMFVSWIVRQGTAVLTGNQELGRVFAPLGEGHHPLPKLPLLPLAEVRKGQHPRLHQVQAALQGPQGFGDGALAGEIGRAHV